MSDTITKPRGRPRKPDCPLDMLCPFHIEGRLLGHAHVFGKQAAIDLWASISHGHSLQCMTRLELKQAWLDIDAAEGIENK